MSLGLSHCRQLFFITLRYFPMAWSDRCWHFFTQLIMWFDGGQWLVTRKSRSATSDKSWNFFNSNLSRRVASRLVWKGLKAYSKSTDNQCYSSYNATYTPSQFRHRVITSWNSGKLVILHSRRTLGITQGKPIFFGHAQKFGRVKVLYKLCNFNLANS